MEMSDRNSFYQHVGAAIRQRRLALGLSQDGLATDVGLTRTSISNIEKGRQKLLLHTLSEIALALRIAPGELLPGAAVAAPPAGEPDLQHYSPEVQSFIKSGIRGVGD